MTQAIVASGEIEKDPVRSASNAPNYCTGNNAIHMFRDEWQHNLIESGLSAVIEAF